MSNRDGAETDPDTEHAGVLARLHTVEEAAEQIGTALDERTTCAELARFLCRHLCDAAAVDLLTGKGTGGRTPSPEALTRVATAGLVKVLEAQFPDGDAPLVRALDEERPVTAAAVLPGGRAVQTVAAPLLAYGRRYGVLLALRAGGSFSGQETATVRHLARLTATRLAHARRHAAGPSPPPAVIGPEGAAGLVDVPVGPPLGTGAGGYELVTRALTPTETLLMFTDGLIERRATNPEAG